MFTLLWKTSEGIEELYSVPSVSFIPGDSIVTSDCNGKDHVTYQSYTAVEGQAGLHLHRSVIGSGIVYVMNENGKTVATYRFD